MKNSLTSESPESDVSLSAAGGDVGNHLLVEPASLFYGGHVFLFLLDIHLQSVFTEVECLPCLSIEVGNSKQLARVFGQEGEAGEESMLKELCSTCSPRARRRELKSDHSGATFILPVQVFDIIFDNKP